MTDKLELKSSHEVVYTLDVADVESIFYCKPTDPDILTVLMKDGKRLYCDEVCPIDSQQEKPVSIWHDASEKPERDDLLIETNDGRIIHRQSINNYGMVKRWAYTSALLNLDNSCNLGNNSQEEPVSKMFEKTFISMVDATHENSGSYSLHDFAQRLYNIAKEELKEPVSEDLELTWEDIHEIFRISEQLKTIWWFRDNEQTKQIGTQVFWEEVLKRFKDFKERKEPC